MHGHLDHLISSAAVWAGKARNYFHQLLRADPKMCPRQSSYNLPSPASASGTSGSLSCKVRKTDGQHSPENKNSETTE